MLRTANAAPVWRVYTALLKHCWPGHVMSRLQGAVIQTNESFGIMLIVDLIGLESTKSLRYSSMAI